MGAVLVTGGAGFLGRAVVARLLSEGRKVVVVDDESTPGAEVTTGPAVRFARADLTQFTRTSLSNYLDRQLAKLDETGWDEVWHLASPASPRLYKERPLETLRLGGQVLDVLCDLAARRETPLLFASSSEVYGDPERAEQHESDPSRIYPTGPRSCYDAAKVYGEAVCAAWERQHDLDVRIVRIHNTYGDQHPGDGRLVPNVVWSALTGRKFMVHGEGTQTRTLGYVDDVVDGIFRVMRSPTNPGVVNVGGTTTVSVVGLVELVQQTVGRFPIEFGPPQDEHDPRRRRPDLTRLRTLGWEPRVDLPTGIQLTAAAMRRRLPAG